MSEDFHVPATPSERQKPVDDEALKVVLIDQSRDAQDEARDRADARLDQELGEGNGFKKFVNGIWKGNIAKEFYRQKYIHQELGTIEEAGNVLVNEPAERRAAALELTVNRFTSDYDDLIHTNAGERREKEADDSDVSAGVKKLIREYLAHGNATVLREERTRFLNEYRKKEGDEKAGKGLATTDNLLEIAQAVAGAVEHAESLENVSSKRDEIIDQVLGRVQVITGEARNGARTEANYSGVDKIVDKLTKTKIGSMVQPSTIAVVAAAAGSIARVGGQGIVGNVTRAIVPGIAAGAWAGLRENKRTKDERTQHAREMAVGGTFEETDKRRVEMEATRYESIPAHDLIAHLNELSDEQQIDKGNDALKAVIDSLAAIQARVDLSDRKKIDLISFSSKTDVGEERMMLDIARREARLAVEARLTDDMRSQLNLGPRAELSGLISQRAHLINEYLVEGEDGLNEKDKAFNKLKTLRIAKAAALGTGVGIVGGLLVQEAVAAIDPSRFGLIDAIQGHAPQVEADGMVHQTTLESIFRGDETITHTDASSTYESYNTAPTGSIELSDDHELVTNDDGTIDLKDGNGEATVEGLIVDANGTFDQASLDKLDAAGMVVEDNSYDLDIPTTTTEVVSTEQYLQNHAAESTAVTRDFWYGNDTPGIYDENELRVYRGGSADAPGLVDGGYQYTVAGMHPGGSWQGGESVDWNQAAASGNLFVAVSGTFDSQGNPFMIPIGPDGAVTIPADSPAGQFFANENNSVAFNGAYMEIVQTSGVDTDGTVHIRPLATLVGDASVGEMTDTVTTVTTEHHAEYVITSDGYDTAAENFTEMAPITPVVPRRSMEAIKTAAAPERPPATNETPGATAESPYDYERAITPEKLERWENERSPRLRDNPDAELQAGEELDYYYEQQRKQRGDEYVAEIEARIEQSEALKGINSETRALVVMPVGAAQESENIYKALSLYSLQDPDAKAKTTIILNVNWIDDAMNDPEKRANIEKTLSEIERAKADFPDLNIADFQKVWSREWVRDVRNGAMYGEVIKTLYDTAAFAVNRAVKDGRASADQDMLMITNDADQLGMNRHYLQHYIEAEEKSKDSDAFIGTIRWGVDAAKDFPGYHVSQLFMQAMNIAATRPNARINPATIGPNAAFRVSTYAAIGGCEDRPNMGAGADSELGRKVLAARGRLVDGDADAYGGYVGNTAGVTGSRERVIRQVVGSDIDSAPERLRDSGYRLNKFMPHAWNQFNNGATRGDDSENANLIEKEDPRKNFPEIQTRVEHQITDFINSWYKDAGTASFTLSMLFPTVDKASGESQAWSLKKDDDGRFSFAFTSDGANRFRYSLLRDSRSRFDPIANRLRRRTYGEVRPGAKRQPVAAEAPLVRAFS